MARPRVRHGRPGVSQLPLLRLEPARTIGIELQDNSEFTTSAIEFFDLKTSAAPAEQAARLTEQFIKQNAPILQLMQTRIERDYDGNDVLLNVYSGNAVGAVPLVSPFTAKPDFGLVIQPRFPWTGIGPMLGQMGWRIAPTPLRLPLLKRSERRVPPWVLSFMVLARLNALLDRLERRFEQSQETRSSPKGTIDWTEYATRQMPNARFLSVPCTFPDLRDDRRLKGAIRYAAERQLQSLQTQAEHGTFIHHLMEFAESILRKVRMVASIRPATNEIEAWLRRPLPNIALFEGLQAIDWTIEERGLAGLSDLAGVPWTMPMEAFFEAWVEAVVDRVARHTGGVMRVGRRRETLSNLHWDPSYVNSQRSLIPDLILEFERTSVVIDAKYKRHWEELQVGVTGNSSEIFREEHRSDLLQVLAYANLAASSDVVCCLVYPCAEATWKSLGARGRLFHRADLPHRGRRVRIWLTAMPMGAQIDTVATSFIDYIRQPI